jgi:hypothetical protein
MTPDEQEAAFQQYLERSENYFKAVTDAGAEPWFQTVEERRKLFMRRYT